jgi:hypothetical protein
MTRPSHATAGAQATRRWRREDCPAELPISFERFQGLSVHVHGITCQAQQTYHGPPQAPYKLPHNHIWNGRINGQRVTVTWKDGGS